MSGDAMQEGLPQVTPVPAGVTSVDAFRRLSVRPHCLFLDSALRHDTLGRYSFVACDPFQTITARPGDPQPLQQLQGRLEQFQQPGRPDLPPFQGGVAGLFGYELNRTLEPKLQQTARPATDPLETPALHVGLYDAVVAFDHPRETGWIISTGWPEASPTARRERAQARAAQLAAWLEEDPPSAREPAETAEGVSLPSGLHPTPSKGVLSNFDAAGYRAAVERAVQYIRDGDVFQVNVAQHLFHQSEEDPRRLYLRLREMNAATFAGFYDAGAHTIVSASPERFLSLRDGLLESRPIKGTRALVRSPEADLFAAADLQASEKDRAENVMIVDLMRNDLSRVCEPDSVQVNQLCQLETYAYVQHLVSSVSGRLRSDASMLDAIRCCFPGGSITGAPKVRAMEIIAELEGSARGAYCGSLGYLGFNGQMDLSILIRTLTCRGSVRQLPVGGGIVAQSTADNEYQETWHKAAGMLRALRT